MAKRKRSQKGDEVLPQDCQVTPCSEWPRSEMQFARIHHAHAELHTLRQPVLLPYLQLLSNNVNTGRESCCCLLLDRVFLCML